jgi:DNA replication licensing factor MCM2
MLRKKAKARIFSRTIWTSERYQPIDVFIRVLTRFSLRDYAKNELLDRYSDAGINDEEDLEELSVTARRAAEAKMARRDRLERDGKRGQRAAVRSRMPHFLDSDGPDEDDSMDELSTMRRRTRRQYDERRDMDEVEGIEDVRFC